MSTETKTIWTRVEGSRTRREAVLLGRQISSEWLSGSVSITQIRLSGEMKQAFSDLIAAAKNIKLNLPIISLRTSLICRIENVVSVDKDLGLVASKSGSYPCAVELYSPDDDDLPAVREVLVKVIRSWIMDEVEIWAERNNLGHLVQRLKETVKTTAVELHPVLIPYVAENGAPNFPLIARYIGESLVGEKLFEGLGNCELVAASEYAGNSVELMTLPTRGPGRDEVFSMVARLTVVSVPYRKGQVFLSVSAMKRVWAKKAPTAVFAASLSVSGYVVAAGRPATRVSVIKSEGGWEFGEEYAALRRESEGKLPASLADAISQREFNTEIGWWAGLPELPILFRSISSRTVLESDEITLLETVTGLLGPLVVDKPIATRDVKIPVLKARTRQEMFKLSDFGVAGAAFRSDDEPEETADSIEQGTATREEKLAEYRKQNVEALRRVHGDVMPIIWMLGGSPEEQLLTRITVENLFGESVKIITEVLPEKTHGLKSDLDHPEFSARKRFDERVKRWDGATKTIKERSGQQHIVALICAPDFVGKKPEDTVNYHAGIHAFSLIGANVHHVLPIESPDDKKSRQNFLHRVQSALLDVMLAHSGAVFGVQPFLEDVLPKERIPNAVYGIQAVRSRAQTRSGQTGVNFLLYSRLLVQSGKTEVRVGYRKGQQNEITPWLPLPKALSWMGSQRRLQDGDANWLVSSFSDTTKKIINEISTKDPNAIVFIEWDGVRSLWKGISDADLGSGNPPRLDGTNLKLFDKMSFVRLRAGINTLSLRAIVKTSFKGWKDEDGVRTDTGEIKVETYGTTLMRLVEISDESNQDSRTFGHYVASMRYPKTVQAKRGLSCYRKMPRMVEVAEGLKEYDQAMLDVASFDAALPAPMDISILSAPSGVNPESIAILAVGLRVGYAHYNDWTKWPMPLFFRRKLEDYVIRYIEDTDGPAMSEDTNPGEPAEALIVPTVYSDLVTQETGGSTDTSAVGIVTVPPPDVLGSQVRNEDEDLLSRVKRTPMPSLVTHDNHQSRRILQRMLNGGAHVSVELPYWVNTSGIFILSNDITKRGVQRSWDWMRNLGYVKSGVSMPRDRDYLNWLARKLEMPQVCATIASAIRVIGQITFRRLAEIIENEYNLSASEEERVTPFAITDEMLERLAKWADNSQHDELMGWLIFMIAQLPNRNGAELVIQQMQVIPGPRTIHALEYYLATVSAVNAVLEQRHNLGYFTIQRSLPEVIIPEPNAQSEKSAVESDEVKLTSDTAFDVVPAPVAEEPHVEDVVVLTRGTLARLVESIEPGSDEFESTLLEIGNQIELLSAKHVERKALRDVERASAEKANLFLERQNAEQESINSLSEMELPRVRARNVPIAVLDAAMDELRKIETARLNFRALHKQLQELDKAPIPMGLQERKKKQQLEQQITDGLSSQIDGARNIIEQGMCFEFEQPNGPSLAEEFVAERQSLVDLEQQEEIVATTSDLIATASPMASAGSVSNDALTKTDAPTTSEAELQRNQEASETAIEETPSVDVLPMYRESEEAGSDNSPTVHVLDDAGVSRLEHVAPSWIAAFDSKLDTLTTLIHRRLYGLADVHLAALGHMFDGEADNELLSNCTILSAIVRTLDLMDCQRTFDMKLDSRLRNVLERDSLPYGRLSDPSHMALGILSAGLSNLLFEPDAQWLIMNAVSACLTDHAALSELINHLQIIKQRGFVLTRDLFVRSQIGDRQAQLMELERFQKRATGWKQEPDIHSSFHHRGFKAMHEEMFSSSYAIGRCLLHVTKGDVAKAASTYEEAKRKFEKPSQTVDELYKKVGEKTKPDGLYRSQAVENIETTKSFVEAYLELASRHNVRSAELSRDLQAFLDTLNRLLSEAVKETRDLKAETKLESLYRDSMVRALECALQLFETRQGPASIPNHMQKLLIQWPLGKDLMPAMKKVDAVTLSLCTADDVFQETERLATEKLTLDSESEDSIERALMDAYQGHLGAKRFLPAFHIERLIKRPLATKGPTLMQQYARERDALIAELREASQRVAHAMTLDALPQETDAYRMQRVIEELLMLCGRDRSLAAHESERTIGTPEVESTAYPDFPHARAALRSNVLEPLESQLSAAKARLEMDLEEEDRKGLLPPADISRIRSMLKSSNAASVRAAYDSLAMLRQSGRLPARVLSSTNQADRYDSFIETLKRSTGRTKQLLDGLKGALAEQGPLEGEPHWLAGLDREQRNESVELIDAWISFFNARSPANTDVVERLFRVLGIPAAPSYVTELARGNRARFILNDKTFLLPTNPDDDLFIPPVLGSWMKHNECFCLYGAVQENDIRQLLQECGGVPTMVLARTQLTMQKRALVSGSAPVLLVDDDLIAYIALHPSGERLQLLLKVGMQTFATNPYDDYGSKPVPTEMFFGRHEELERLRNVKGLAVLYGGRRLGKSSLLNQIEWESRNIPGKETVYVSMETIITSDHVLSAWEFIYRALVNRKIISPLLPVPKLWKPIVDHIGSELVGNASLKSLYLLIDEANDLMGCELRMKRSEIGFVRGLTQLADDVAHKCQLRMVIAGLHNITRMANDENSVFGKLEPIPLKPFSTSDDVQRGIRLITKPLAAMGYEFSRGAEDLPLRILSVCNFYPAFVQLYCKRLVERLQNKRHDKAPPIGITEEDLNAVEKDNNLLTELREKFKLNLNLDKRYKAIALILADIYYAESEGGEYRGLTTLELRDYCEVYCPRHFENTGPGVYEALLDEMSKLNVVEKVGTRYVLRNPNIAMMVGDRDRVSTLINELASEPPETSRNHGERRILMSRNSLQVMFPMPMSWVRNHMDGSDGELLVLTGNAQSGIMDLVNLGRDEWRLQDGVFVTAPANSPQTLGNFVLRDRRGAQDHRGAKIVCMRPSSWRVEQIPEYAAIANKAGKHGIRIILLAPPQNALEIALALQSKALKSADDNQRGWRVVPIPPWTNDAIYYLIHENIRVAENQGAIDAVSSSTGGFGTKVMELCNETLTLEQALNSQQTMRQSLTKNLGEFYQTIGIPPSLIEERGPAIKDFLNMLDGCNRSNLSEIEETKTEYRISEELFQFLYWMGLIQEGPSHTWVMAKPYAQLIR